VREKVREGREGGKASMTHAFQKGFVRLVCEDASGWRVYRLKEARMVNELREALAVQRGGGEGGRVGGTGCLQLRRWRNEEEKKEGGGEMPWVSFAERERAEGQGKAEKVETEVQEKKEEKSRREEEEQKQERVRAVARHVLEGGLKADLFVELCECFNGQWPKGNERESRIEKARGEQAISLRG